MCPLAGFGLLFKIHLRVKPLIGQNGNEKLVCLFVYLFVETLFLYIALAVLTRLLALNSEIHLPLPLAGINNLYHYTQNSKAGSLPVD